MPYAFVNTGQNSANSNVITYSPAAGNLVILSSETSQGAGSPTITGVQTNTSVAMNLDIATYNTGAITYTSLCSLVVGSGVTSFTVTYNGGTPGTCLLYIAEYSGLTGTLIGSAHNGQTNIGNATDAYTSTAGTVTLPGGVPGALVFGVCMGGSSSTDTAGTGYTQRLSVGSGDACIEDKRVTSTASYAATFTSNPGTGNPTNCMMAAYGEPGGAAIILMGQACL